MRQLEDCVWVISKKNFETIYKDATLKMVEKSNEKGLNCKYLFFPHFKFDEKGQLFYDEQKIDIAPKIAYIRGYDLELINGYEIYKNLYILLGIEYEKLNYRDTQDEKQNFMKHDNILYKIGIEYNF